jgi:hypothetical protein
VVDYGFSWFWVDVAHEWDDRVKIIKVWCLCFGMKRVVNFGFGLVVLLGIGLVFAYVQSIPSPGHGGDKVFIVVNGDSIDLQGAIDAGYFDTSYAGWGAYSGVVNSGQLGEDIFVSLGGVNKNFQEAINDGSLCTFVPVPGSYSYSGSYPVGHNGEDVLVDFGVEKSLQKAIDDGDFYECVLVNCAGSWNLNVAPCSVSACGSSGNYDARYTVSAIAEYGGTACAVADGTFVNNGGNVCSTAACPVNCAGSWNLNYGSCSVSACGSSGNYDALWTTTVSAVGTGTACPSPTFVNNGGNACSTAACPVNCVGSWNRNVAPCSVSACGSTGNYDRQWTTTTSPANGGTACPSPTFVNNGGNACSTAACPAPAPAPAPRCAPGTTKWTPGCGTMAGCTCNCYGTWHCTPFGGV